jgi:hypothetical protein
MSVVKFKAKPKRIQCSSCGAEGTAGCDCGAPYVTPGERAATAAAAYPEKSDGMIAREIGVDRSTVTRARNSTRADAPVERVGLDGKKRRSPKPKLVYDDDDMPSEEEAEESWQSDLYDQACLLLERMAGKTRRRIFAHIRKVYGDEIQNY